MTRERGVLAGDACLLTAAAFGLVMGTFLLTFRPEAEPAEDATWVSLLSTVLSLAVMILGPLGAWRLHGRRLIWIAVLGAVVGGFVVGNVVTLLAMLVLAPLVWLVSWVSSSELAGLIAIFVPVGAAFVALLVWLVADGVRDLAPSRRVHPRLDVVRIISATVLVAFTIGVALWTANHPDGSENGEAIIFAMAFGMGAAMVVTGAEAATSLAARTKSGTGASGT